MWEQHHWCQVRVGRSFVGQWPGWACQRLDSRWHEEKNLRREQQGWQVDLRTTTSRLGAAHSTQQSHSTNTFLSCLWIRSYPLDVHHVEISNIGDVQWRRGRWARQLELDSTKEIRCDALIQPVRYLQGVRRYRVTEKKNKYKLIRYVHISMEIPIVCTSNWHRE